MPANAVTVGVIALLGVILVFQVVDIYSRDRGDSDDDRYRHSDRSTSPHARSGDSPAVVPTPASAPKARAAPVEVVPEAAEEVLELVEEGATIKDIMRGSY